MLPLRCQECGRTFTYTHQLRRHRKVHMTMNRTVYRCKVCNETFPYLTDLRRHLDGHFHPTANNGLYMDDLAIGVTIEPVDEDLRGADVGHGSRGHGTLSQSGPRCCRSHQRSTSSCGSGPGSKCRSVMLIDPLHVVHVDLAHDPSLSYPGSALPWSADAVASVWRRDFGGRDHVEQDVGEENGIYDSDVGRISPRAGREDTEFQGSYYRDTGDVSERDSRPEESRDTVVSPMDAMSTGSSRLATSVPQTSVIPPPACQPYDQGPAILEDDIGEFDDMATSNDLLDLFPDFNEKNEEKPNADSKPENDLDDLVHGNVVDPLPSSLDKIYPTSPRCIAPRTDLSSSDLEACVRFGLDSKAINPTVVVNDLQREISRLQRAVRVDAFTCELCDVGFETNGSLLTHIQTHRHILGHGNERRMESEHGKLADISDNPKSKGNGQKRREPGFQSSKSKPKRKLKDDSLLKFIEKAGKTFTNRNPRPKFRVTVSKLKIECYICGKVFTTKQHFVMHAKRHLKMLGYSHARRDLFYCTICYAFYPCESKLRDHLVDIHGNDEDDNERSSDAYNDPRPYSEFQTDVASELSHTSQVEVDGSSSFGNRGSPSDSDVVESSTDQLMFPEHEHEVPDERISVEHCQNSWSGMCHICGQAFSRESDLNEHISSCNRVELTDETEDKPRMRFSASYKMTTGKKIGLKCHICGRIFSSVKALKTHFVTHDPRRAKMKCPVKHCSGSYAWKQNFKRHLLQHAAPRGQYFKDVMFNVCDEILCPFCGRAMLFSSVDDYKLHMLLHIDKVMAKECAMNDLSYASSFRVRKSKTSENNRRAMAQMQWGMSSSVHISDLGVGDRSTASTHQPADDGSARNRHPFPASSAAQSSTPNSCSGFNDTASNNVDRRDLGVGNCLQGNSGNFISPVWVAGADHEAVYRGGGGCGGQTQTASVRPGRWGDGQPASDARSRLPMDLNDSGFTQTPSSESDLGDGSREPTPQQHGLPSFSSFSSNPRIHGHNWGSYVPDMLSYDKVKIGGDRFLTGGDARPYAPRIDSRWGNPEIGHPSGQYGDQSSYSSGQYGDQSSYSSTATVDHLSLYGDGRARTNWDGDGSSSSQIPDQRLERRGAMLLTLDRVERLMETSQHMTLDFKSEGMLCSICGALKLTMDNVKKHLLGHFDASGNFAFTRQGKKFDCPMCFKVIQDRKSATAHLFCHWGETLIRCPMCRKPFNLVKTLWVHLHRQHRSYRFTNNPTAAEVSPV